MDKLRARGREPIVVDTGDTFFRSMDPHPDDREQMALKARFIARAYSLLGMTAFLPGELDFSQGRDFLVNELLATARVPVLGANVYGSETASPLFASSRLVEHGGLSILLIGLCNATYDLSGTGQALSFSDPVVAARKLVETRPPSVDLVVALSHLGAQGDEELARTVGEIDVIVGGHDGKALEQPRVVGSTLVVRAPGYGRYVGHVELLVDQTIPRGQSIPLGTVGTAHLYWKNTLHPLSKDLGSCAAIDELVDTYRREVMALHSRPEVRKKRLLTKRQYFLTVRKCRLCHEAQYRRWLETPHARAMKTLKEKFSHLDLECIGCHTIGFRTEGGYRHPADMGRFEAVQCEACHGPGSDHMNFEKVFLTRASRKTTCLRCHDEEHDPDFDFVPALGLVRCPERGPR